MAELNCTCGICGKKFHKPPSSIKRGRGKYCSVECRAKGGVGRINRKPGGIKRVELADAMYDALSGRLTIEEAAAKSGMSYPTFTKYIQKLIYDGEQPPDRYFVD